MLGLGGKRRTDMVISKADALACPRGFAEPHFIRINKLLETLEFREPYRIRGVQSLRDKWAFSEKTTGLAEEESGVQMKNPCRYWA
jgi:hypothetical protein